MERFKFDTIDIKKKIKYISQELKNPNLTSLEKEKLQKTLIAYFGILDSSGNFINTILPNFLDRITKNNYSNSRDNKRICKTGELELKKEDFGILTTDYLSFLLNLALIIQKPNEEDVKFKYTNIENLDLKNISLEFYKNIDNDFYKIIDEIFAQNKLINILNNNIYDNTLDNGLILGVTYYDYIYNQAYCTITKEKTNRDIQVFIHELMHSIEFAIQPKLTSNNYYGFHETLPYCIDLLLIDYLIKEKNIEEMNITQIKNERINYIRNLAYISLYQIYSKLSYTPLEQCSINKIITVVDEEILKNLLEVQSGIMAIGLFNQIKENKKIGITNLKLFIKTLIPKDKIPDFSYLNLSQSQLIDICKNIVELENNNLENKFKTDKIYYK